MPDGTRVRILRVGGDPMVRERLVELGLTPGSVVRVLRRAPLGDPVELEVRGGRLAVRADEAAGVDVEPA